MESQREDGKRKWGPRELLHFLVLKETARKKQR